MYTIHTSENVSPFGEPSRFTSHPDPDKRMIFRTTADCEEVARTLIDMFPSGNGPLFQVCASGVAVLVFVDDCLEYLSGYGSSPE